MTKNFFEIPALFLRTKKCSISFKTKLVVLYPILLNTLPRIWIIVHLPGSVNTWCLNTKNPTKIPNKNEILWFILKWSTRSVWFFSWWWILLSYFSRLSGRPFWFLVVSSTLLDFISFSMFTADCLIKLLVNILNTKLGWIDKTCF